ncbi:MAG: hypothetical protein AAF721_07760 [Myxococcota bacterium]
MSDSLDETLQAFEELMEVQASEPATPAEGEHNFRCEHCVACSNCRFCTECDNCRDCTYCYGCRDSLSLTQSRSCDACEKLSHSDLCADCVSGSYLTLCVDCEDCVQCFGCVGLVGEEFCILNEKLPRKEYFARVKELRAELDLRVRQGWSPPWREVDQEEVPAVEAEPAAPAEEVLAPEEPAPIVAVPAPPVVEPPAPRPPPSSVAPTRETPIARLDLEEPTLRHERLSPLSHPADEARIPPLTRLDDGDAEGPREAWREGEEPPLQGELPPFPELPPETDDSGVWAAKTFGDVLPPPPPYTPPVEASPRGDEATRLYAPLDDQPTLTRGARPVPRRDKAAPVQPGRRGSLRRARRPSRD